MKIEFNRTAEDAGRYYLYNTSITAYVIPKKVFKTNDEIGQFEKLIKRYPDNNI